jgi:hypothetical protein
VLTDEDTAQLRTIASQMVQLYPDMAKYIDETTGQFNTNTTAIRNNINALADSQMATAYYTATQEYRTALLDSAVAQQKAQKAYDDAYANWQSKSIDLSSIEALYSAVTSNTQASAQYAGQLKMLDSRFDGFFDRLDDGTYVLNDFGQQAIGSGDFLMLLDAALVNVSAEEQKASSATVDLFTTLETANEATATATENLASATTACEQYGDVLIYTANTNDGLVQSQEDSIATTDEQSAALAALKETLKSLADQTLKTVESQVSGFEKMGRVGKQSARSTISALKSQQKYMTDYSTNLDKAREKGVSEEVLAALSDGTTESAKILAGLAKANQTQVDQINELYTATQQQKTELAATLADEQAKLVEANQSLADTGADAGTAVAATGTNTAAELAKARGEAAAAGQGISAAATTAKTAETSIETSKENAKTATQEMVDGVGQIVEDSASDIEQTGADIVDSVATGIRNNNAAKNALRSQVSVAMASARSTSYTGGRSIGTNIMRGLHDGLAGMSDNLNAAMKTIVYSLLKAAKDAAGVKSPSTLFRDQLGNYLAQGIGVGFSGTMNEQVLPTIAASIGAAAKAGQDVLDNTLLAKVQRITGLQLPSMASVTNSIMRGSAIATAAAGATYNSTTINAQQYVTFEKQMQAPDEIARSIRRNATYGLAGAKA